MAPVTFHLVALKAGENDNFIDTLKSITPSERPAWIGKCHHWIHQPHLSTAALTGTGPGILKWDYLLVTKSQDPIPSTLQPIISRSWSISSNPPDELIAAIASQQSDQPVPSLPQGWSPSDHSGLDAAIAPPDLEASLALESYPLGCKDTSISNPIVLKDFIWTFGTSHPGPIAMFNLLSYLPDQRENYFKYVAAFQESVGSTYGGTPLYVGFDVKDWTSREKDEYGWEDTALIGYPSIWHFGKMLDSEGYADADRRFKQGVIRDNPLICCTEVEI